MYRELLLNGKFEEAKEEGGGRNRAPPHGQISKGGNTFTKSMSEY